MSRFGLGSKMALPHPFNQFNSDPCMMHDWRC